MIDGYGRKLVSVCLEKTIAGERKKKTHQEEEEMLVLNSLLSLGENKINNKIQQISHPHI